jgi:penicillin-binding protein 1A
MSIDDDTLSGTLPAPATIAFEPRSQRHLGLGGRHGFRPRRPRVRKLRLLFVLSAFLVLAVISMLFGVLTSIASDLPELENTVQFRSNVDSYMYSADGTPLGPLAPATKPSVDKWVDISKNMRNAIVAVEDKGFWGESGISVRGLLRAAVSDVTGGKFEGGSTIPEEFIKNVRKEEDDRTVGEKVVEAGMAFQLTHRWTHRKILTEYLNTIYFGNGALGVEAAARAYFGQQLGYDATGTRHGCGDPSPQNPHRKECASKLDPAQAALLATMVANPTEFNPVTHKQATLARRNDVVLKDMYEQGYLTRRQYVNARKTPLPTAQEIEEPQEQTTKVPYYTSWVAPLVVHALRKEGLSAGEAQYQAYYGGLKIRLGDDLHLQNAAQIAVNEALPAGYGLPSASLVAINNRTGVVEAMVSGDGVYQESPFNLATLGYRQPGSAFKLFTLAAAIQSGKWGPESVIDSKPLKVPYQLSPGHTAIFNVHNFGNVYGGPTTLATATATSDNSVFTQVGISVGTRTVAEYAHKLGIRSPISTYPAMILGGLTTGVSALDLAHAYATEANGGLKVWNKTLGDYHQGPIGIVSITGCVPCRQRNIYNSTTLTQTREISSTTAATIHELLLGPVDDSYGTGTAARIPGVDVIGKTGTTSNYADAWFVGSTPTMTAAVWVGYPNSGKSMATDYYGKPVEGGTYPAIIWHNFMTQALEIQAEEAAGKKATVSSQTPADIAPTTTHLTGTGTATGTSTTGASTQTTQTTAAQQTQGASSSSGTSSAGSSSSSAQSVTPTTSTPPPAANSGTGANGGSGL